MCAKSEDVIFWAHLGRTRQVRAVCSPTQCSERMKDGKHGKANGHQGQVWNNGLMNCVKDTSVIGESYLLSVVANTSKLRGNNFTTFSCNQTSVSSHCSWQHLCSPFLRQPLTPVWPKTELIQRMNPVKSWRVTNPLPMGSDQCTQRQGLGPAWWRADAVPTEANGTPESQQKLSLSIYKDEKPFLSLPVPEAQQSLGAVSCHHQSQKHQSSLSVRPRIAIRFNVLPFSLPTAEKHSSELYLRHLL